MKIVAIGTRLFSTGFKIAGLEDVTTVSSTSEFEEKLEELLNNQEVGIILAEDEFLSSINWKLKKEIENRAVPVVVPVNVKGKEVVGESIDVLIKRALGFELKK